MKMSAIHATATTMTLAKSKINDDKMEIENWFKGFEKGLERLSPEQRSAFLSECGRNCMNGGTLSVYQQLHDRAWNAPVSCAKKDMSPLHCSASVHAKA